MIPAPVGYLLVLAALVHLFVSIYNRYLLCLTDGTFKRIVHQAWFIACIPLPAALLLVGRDESLPRQLLTIEPTTRGGWLLVAALFALLAFLAVQAIEWLTQRLDRSGESWIAGERRTTSSTPSRHRLLPPQGHWGTEDDLCVVERDLVVPCLPAAFDGFRIAQVSDIHFNSRFNRAAYWRELVAALAGHPADLVIFTGDFVDRAKDIPASARFHARVAGKLPSLAVLGNHDYWTDPDLAREWLSRVGIAYIGGGQRREISRQGRRLVFVGTDAPWRAGRVDWRRLLARGEADALVLVSHTPDNAPVAARHGANLVLCGHTHGGEICLPLFGPVFMPSRYGLRFAAGVYQVGPECLLNVSRGIGVSMGRRRLFCPPELVLLTLRAPAAQAMVGACNAAAPATALRGTTAAA